MSNCVGCKYHVPLSQAEQAWLKPRLEAAGAPGQVSGCCMFRGDGTKELVRGYLNKPVEGCPYRSQGYYSEAIARLCPTCRKGTLRVVRLAREGAVRIFIGCSNYPECRFTASRYSLNQVCRYCNHQLAIRTDGMLSIECPTCGRGASAPVLAAGWPSAGVVRGLCSHVPNSHACPICARSAKERQSVIEIELPAAVEHWRRIQASVRIVSRQEIDDHIAIANAADGYASDAYDGWLEALEEMEAINSENFSFASSMARSDDEGWFYADEDRNSLDNLLYG